MTEQQSVQAEPDFEFSIQSYPTEEYRWVVIHPHEGTLFFPTQEQRDQYAEEAAVDLAGSDLLSELCCGELDVLFEPHGRVH